MKNIFVRLFLGIALVCGATTMADDGPKRLGEPGVAPGLLPKDSTRRPEASEIEEKKLNVPLSLSDMIEVFSTYFGKPANRGGDIKEREIEISSAPRATVKELAQLFLFALHNNGLGVDGSAGFAYGHFSQKTKDWNNRAEISKTKMIRLGYLDPEPILSHYLEKIGRAGGSIALNGKGNFIFVSDSAKALNELEDYIQKEIIRLSVTGEALSSEANRHFYVIAYAKQLKIPLLSKKTESCTKEYKTAALWTTPRGFAAMANEFARISNLGAAETESGVLSVSEQEKVSVDHGLVKVVTESAPAETKKGATKKRAKR